MINIIGIVCFSFSVFSAELEITEPWVAMPLPGVSVTATYLKVKNTSKKDIDLIAVSSPSFKDAEMHKTIKENGMGKMIKQDNVLVKAGSHLEFVPGGLHLMMFDLKTKLKLGDMVEINLKTRDQKTITFQAKVKKRKSSKHKTHKRKH